LVEVSKEWKMDTVKGVTNTVVDVTLTEAVTVADVNAAVIKNAAGTVVTINDAVLSADGKLITLYTDAQVTGNSYTITAEHKGTVLLCTLLVSAQ